MPQRSYTDEERTAALLALAANGGNVKQTALQLGLPRKTLETWHRGIHHAHVAETCHAKRLPLADQFEAIAHRALDLLPGRLEEASPRDLIVVAAVAADKMRLLREQPTHISAHTFHSDAERADRILALLGSGGESARRPGGHPQVN